jgi:hypothetical protein
MKTNKPSVKSMDIAHHMFSHWCATAEAPLKEKWYKCHLTFWQREGKDMCSVRWSPFDLDIASFVIPKELPSGEEIDACTTQQELVLGSIENGEPPIVSTKQSPNGTLATVSEVVDAFLEGVWTPYWPCAMCRKRYNGNAKPI